METLINTFHNTEAKVRTTYEERLEIERIAFTGDEPEAGKARAQIRRVWNKLCGIDGCTCGNSWGERN